MKTMSVRIRTLVRGVVAIAVYCGLAIQPAAAQPARAHRNLDANGVDLTHGDFLLSFVEGSIGSGETELPLIRNNVWVPGVNGHQWDRIMFQQWPISGGTRYMVTTGARFEQFDGTGSLPTGSSLSGSGGSFTYRRTDGTEIEFSDPTGAVHSTSPYCNGSQTSCSLLPTSIASPDGKTVSLTWYFWIYCWGLIDEGNMPCTTFERLSSVSNSYGYEARFSYASGGDGADTAPPNSWFQRTGATFHNNSVSGSPSQGSVSYSYPSAGVTQVTDMSGRVWRFTGTSDQVTGVRRPGASSDTTTISYGTGGVTSVTRDGVTTNYSRGVSGTTATMTVTNALSQAMTIVSDLTVGRPTSVTDALSRTTSYQYDSNGRLTRVTAPEGNYVQYTLDARGNVTQAQAVAKSGSGLSNITVSASYDSTCSNPVTCNQPNTTTDARGNVTDYTYDSTHGGVLTVTAPAPTSGAVRPQTRYSYTLANGEYQVTGISACQTEAGGSPPLCADEADEAKTTIAYDSNGNVTSVSGGNGSGTLTATTAMTYDALGNLLTVDGPLSGTADTTRYRYDAARARIGEISPDPDGGGSLKHRAVRMTINSDGLMTKVERGTVDSLSDSDWTAFSSLEAVEAAYDSNGRPITHRLIAGGTTYALAQTSYDALGRVECVAQRMNPSEFASLPSSACSLDTQGSYGPDRIVKTIRDAAGHITQTKTAFGASEEANEVTSTYSNNGRLATVTDGEGNKTTYEYDGHDRLSKTRFPSPTKGAGTSSTTDYEQLTYDANANVTSRRPRDGNSIGYTFDALNRLTAKDLPGSEPDVTYTYDVLSRMTGASQTGNALSFTYDALNRNLTQVGPKGTVTSTYDAAGRRTRITHPDGFYVQQDYLVTGEMSAIRETDGAGGAVTSGAGVLATYAYDNLGRRASLTRGNGSVQTYSFDAVSRLSQLADDLPGTTTYDQTLGFSYNPASEITSATRSNDLYAWGNHYNVNRNYTSNGLNQYTASGSITPTYDSKGNLTSAGSITYGYSSENLLTSATGGKALSYDPMLRLYQTVGTVTTRLAYDGANLVAEYGQVSGNEVVLRRYVHGPGTDEPIVWYEGPNTTDRRFLHADERGSVIAVSNSSGAIIGTNSYDEYGIPAATNIGRFQYTGQTWLSDLSMYYYKARIYSPTHGRFMQTDPIGYGDGMNLYAYVGADPANARDPSGLACDGDWLNGSGGCEVSGSSRGGSGGGGGGGGGTGGRFTLNMPISEGGGGDGSSDGDMDCEIGAISISKRGNQVTITGQMQFAPQPGSAAVPSSFAANAIAAINFHWSGPFGNLNVTTQITAGSGGITAHVGPVESASLAGPVNLPSMPGPFTGAARLQWGRTVAHEFGHYLGLSSEVIMVTFPDGRVGPSYPHLDGGIMGKRAPPAPKMQSHIDEILQNCTPTT